MNFFALFKDFDPKDEKTSIALGDALSKELRQMLGSNISLVRSQFATMAGVSQAPSSQREIFRAVWAGLVKKATKERVLAKAGKRAKGKIPSNRELFVESKEVVQKLINPIIGSVAHQLSERPFSINGLAVFITEVLYWFLDKEMGEKRMRFLQPFLSELSRRVEIGQDTFHYPMKLDGYEFTKAMEALAIKVITLRADEPLYQQFLAFTISQTPPAQIAELLEHQASENPDALLGEIVEALLYDEYFLLSESQVAFTQKWLDTSNHRSSRETAMGNIGYSIETESLRTFAEITPMEKLHGEVSDKSIRRFFDLFAEQKNSRDEPYLSPAEVEFLKIIGLSIPKFAPPQKLTIAAHDREKGIFYYSFFKLWECHSDNRKPTLRDFARYMKAWFSNFGASEASISKMLKEDKPSYMDFDLFERGYLTKPSAK